MQLTDLKVYALNALAISLSFSGIEIFLKIILLLLSIGYTATKWWEIRNNIKNNKNGKL